ncbi:unnamed protein product [Durusdinium trenchii]|uniref:Uncharacterized protein n=2 Tax=Durusdinium trenchii TaxID=1381693 RepID=A0ABP0N6D3_9DINO
MPRERELEGSVRDCDALETLTDKLRSGEFSEAISAAQRASEQGPLCARADGGVKRADPYVAFAGVEAPVQVDEEDELTRLRRERKAQLQKEQIWKKQGHGALRELADEKEFVQSIAPHERAVMLLDDGGSAAGEVCRKVLGRLASKHLEAQFCWLSAEKAFFLTQMIDLQAFPTIFVLSYGEVTRHLPPSQLFCYSSASSPLFPKHFRSLLHRSGAIEHAEDSESGSDAGESD